MGPGTKTHSASAAPLANLFRFCAVTFLPKLFSFYSGLTPLPMAHLIAAKSAAFAGPIWGGVTHVCEHSHSRPAVPFTVSGSASEPSIQVFALLTLLVAVTTIRIP